MKSEGFFFFWLGLKRAFVYRIGTRRAFAQGPATIGNFGQFGSTN